MVEVVANRATGATEFACFPGVTTNPVTLKIGDQTVNVDRRFLQLSPEQQNETVDEIAKALSLRGTTATIREYAPHALLPPLVTLVLGLLGAWVVSGFARKGAA